MSDWKYEIPKRPAMDVEQVVISRRKYESLVRDSDFLTCLVNCGVDNWDGYDFARDEMNK